MIGRLKLYRKWGFLEVTHEVGQYYRNLFKLTFGLKLQRPSNEEHITVISPWDNVDLLEFTRYNGMELSFERDGIELFWNTNAVWFPVKSNDIMEFRQELGLGPPGIDLHFCIGYFSNE